MPYPLWPHALDSGAIEEVLCTSICRSIALHHLASSWNRSLGAQQEVTFQWIVHSASAAGACTQYSCTIGSLHVLIECAHRICCCMVQAGAPIALTCMYTPDCQPVALHCRPALAPSCSRLSASMLRALLQSVCLAVVSLSAQKPQPGSCVLHGESNTGQAPPRTKIQRMCELQEAVQP